MHYICAIARVFVCMSVYIRMMLNLCFTRRRSLAEYWKYFVARFNDVHAFGYNSAGSERIWMKFSELRVCCLELALTDFGRDALRSDSGRPCGSFVFCRVNNARLCRFRSAKFHEICTQDVVLWRGESFRNNFFENLPLRGLFSKNRDHRQRFPTSSRDFSEMITNLGKSWQTGAPTECWLSIRTVGINSKSFAWPAGSVRERTFLDIGGVHRMTFIDVSLPNGHAASACSLDVTLHYYKVIRGAAVPFGCCVIAQLRVN